MRKAQRQTIFSFIALFSALSLYAQQAEEMAAYWVFFHDKEVTDQEIFNPLEFDFPHLSQRALDRRVLRGTITGPTYSDIDVSQAYVDEIQASGLKIRTTSRWLNAVSVLASPAEAEALSNNSIVKKTKRIRKLSKKIIKQITRDEEELFSEVDYGLSYHQNEQINAVAAHELGLTGADVWLLMLDTGYFTDHLAFQGDRIVAEYDFLNADSITQNEMADTSAQHNHGTAVASVAGGYLDGEMRGVAYGCKFLFAKTETLREEIQAEEDYSVAALEWGEALGADIASSSLGYIDWYSYSDMDGKSAITTRGVDYAVSLGMVCVTAAGNEGNQDWHFIVAPADADSVISVGAVDESNTIASFSSHGPTYDGRIKPEVLARGVATHAAGTSAPTAFIAGSGTSMSTPLVAGAAALLLEAHPNWTPMMVREALMMTADGSLAPDNTRGFGLIDVMAALNYDFGIVPGDVSQDELLNVNDAVILLEWILDGTEISEIQFNTGDINQDNRMDILDIVVLVEWILTL